MEQNRTTTTTSTEKPEIISVLCLQKLLHHLFPSLFPRASFNHFIATLALVSLSVYSVLLLPDYRVLCISSRYDPITQSPGTRSLHLLPSHHTPASQTVHTSFYSFRLSFFSRCHSSPSVFRFHEKETTKTNTMRSEMTSFSKGRNDCLIILFVGLLFSSSCLLPHVSAAWSSSLVQAITSDPSHPG